MGQIRPTLPSKTLISTGQTAEVLSGTSFNNITIIDHSQIQLFNFQTLNDLLQYTLNNFSVYLGKDGYALNYAGTGQKNVKILLDGLPIFQTSIDRYDLSKIALLDVERVEILTGSNSVYNGSNAALATINIITKIRRNSFWDSKISVNTSSLGNLNGLGKIAHNTARTNTSLAFGQYFFSGVGGYDSNRVFQWKPQLKTTVQFSHIYKITNNLSAFAKIEHNDSRVQDRGYPIANTLRVYDTDQKVRQQIFHGGIKGKLSKYHTIDFSHSYTNFKSTNKNTIKILSTLQSAENSEKNAFDILHYDEFFSQMKISKNNLKNRFNYETGIEFSHQRDLERSVLHIIKTNITQLAFLGNTTLAIDTNLFLKTGFRLNTSSKFGTKPIGEIGLKYLMSEQAILLVNMAQGYRTPTFNEMFYTYLNPTLNILGNLELKSEIFNQINSTLRINSNEKLSFLTNFYWLTSRNGIQLASVNPELQLYQFVNSKHSKLIGQSFQFQYHDVNWFVEFAASNNGINQYPKELGNYYFNREFLAKSSYLIESLNFTFSAATKYSSPRSETRENALGELEDFNQAGFWLVDISIRQKLFGKNIFGLFGVKNLGNTLNVAGSYLNLDRISDSEINRKVPLSIDYGRRFWFSLVSEF
ncbi:MAG: TonB-dependent receptor plug domain-containing protein [Flavobacteriales bacterium]|nr:TonB-dependent receptor plug domain-containing protein [Flavobacteriales bacterium]